MACCYSNCENTTTSELKRCAGCRKVRYCSSRCQKLDWPSHIFDCKTGKPISTVYYLVRAVKTNTALVHRQTRIDYGFLKAARVLEPEDDALCGLYSCLVPMLADPYVDLRRLQKEGRLVEGIKQTFQQIPPSQRGFHYRWFLQHQYIVDGTPADEGTVELRGRMLTHSKTRSAWLYAGGSSIDTQDAISDGMLKLAQQSPHRFSCFVFASFLFDNPPEIAPIDDIWLKFGLVAGPKDSAGRTDWYRDLIRRCTFEELCEAYETSSMPALFARHDIMLPDRHRVLFEDVMSGSPATFKTVWHLKKYVCELPRGPRPGEQPASYLAECAIYDYGYGNCKNAEERKLLDELYMQLFAKDGMDPLALHAACLQGELLQFAKSFVKLSPRTATYTRLLRNGHPLSNCKELSVVPYAPRRS